MKKSFLALSALCAACLTAVAASSSCTKSNKVAPVTCMLSEGSALNTDFTVNFSATVCTNDKYSATVYGAVTDGVATYNIVKDEYGFTQLVGRVWTAEVATDNGAVNLYLRRAIVGKTLAVESTLDKEGKSIEGEIGEGYGDAVWFTCFSYNYI